VLAQRLRAGGLVCLPADRDVTGGGIEVDFFGEKAHMMGGAAALAVQTGAALLPATLWFDGPLWCALIHEEIPVPDSGTRREKVAVMTEEVARVFEGAIALHPEDWHMLQRVFTADLDLDRLAAAEATAQAADAAAEAAEVTVEAAEATVEAAAAPGRVDSGAGRAARNGQVDGAALDGLSGGAGDGGSEP
jgi:KDO2-lipid IV(A) lauroyltransferase